MLLSIATLFQLQFQPQYAYAFAFAFGLPGTLHSPLKPTTPSRSIPRLIVFDLDGCLWKPELHELARFSGSRKRNDKRNGGNSNGSRDAHAVHDQSPFTKLMTADGCNYECRSNCGFTISLFKDVPIIFLEILQLQLQLQLHLYQDAGEETTDSSRIMLAISSRTEHPEWAVELLGKFDLSPESKNDTNNNHTTLDKTVFSLQHQHHNQHNNHAIAGPWIIDSTRSKVLHFQQLSDETGIPYTEMVFFDNNPKNCKSVSRLGVTVGYCPHGLSLDIFHKTMSKFPLRWGVVGLQIK